eukprot:2882-Pleurochrysis_carterae.AAC.2
MSRTSLARTDVRGLAVGLGMRARALPIGRSSSIRRMRFLGPQGSIESSFARRSRTQEYDEPTCSRTGRLGVGERSTHASVSCRLHKCAGVCRLQCLAVRQHGVGPFMRRAPACPSVPASVPAATT